MAPLDRLAGRDLLERLPALLDAERRAEADQQQAARAGRSLAAQEADGLLNRHLHVSADDPGPAGLWRLRLARADGAALPPLDCDPGAPISVAPAAALAEATRPGAVSGVLERREATALSLLVDAGDAEDLGSGPLAVWPASSGVTFERARAAVSAALEARGRTRELVEVLTGARPPRAPSAAPLLEDAAALHATQQAAVAHALGAPDVALIHGPPGTGKTTTAAMLVLHALRAGERVLCCAASNTGADELCRALTRLDVDALRVGHPARVDESLHPCLLQERVHAHPRYQLAEELFRNARRLRASGNPSRRAFRDARAERAEKRAELRAMMADARTYMAQAEQDVLARARVVCCTLTVSGGPPVNGLSFDLLVLDEASQATIPLALVPLGRVERAVLVGDHQQLPPTVVSREAERGGLGVTLFERLAQSGAPGTLLTCQHRMHRDLMAFPSARHYGGRLTAAPAVADRTLQAVLGGTLADGELAAPFGFIDTAGTGWVEDRPEGGSSVRNPGEAALCAALVRQLVRAGLALNQMGVIAPYRAQVAELAARLADEVRGGLEVDTVDAFQGREKEAILVSLTRSNTAGEVGFVEDARRLNVALTRARVWLRVLGDGATVGVRAEGAALLAHAEATGAHVSAYALEGFAEVAP
ncbi:MAG: AAA family ATPase [Deltaproteobacteria bacterium]|nr:AAA family ATPase [Deltaproteobacteria bacterium]